MICQNKSFIFNKNNIMLTYFFYLLIILLTITFCFMLYSFIYSVITALKQDKEFKNNLKVGDHSNYGIISEVHDGYVVINRDPLKIPIKDLTPKEYKGNWFFLFNFNKD